MGGGVLRATNISQGKSVKTVVFQLWSVDGEISFNPGVVALASSNHLIRSSQNVSRYRQADLLSGFQVDNELKLGGLLHTHTRHEGMIPQFHALKLRCDVRVWRENNHQMDIVKMASWSLPKTVPVQLPEHPYLLSALQTSNASGGDPGSIR